MNPGVRRKMVIGGVGVALLAGAWWGYRDWYAMPRDELQVEIEGARGRVRALEGELEEGAAVRKRLRAIASGTLGKKIDVVEHKFLAGLTALGERDGLSGVVASAGAPKAQISPLTASGVKGVGTGMRRALRGNPDFEVVQGQIRGRGTLEQALRVLAEVQSQPWIHRVDSFTLRPVGKEDQFELSVGVMTLLLGDLAKDDEGAVKIAEISATAEAQWRPIAAKNVFREPIAPPKPPAPEVRTAQGEAPKALPKPPAYEEWKLTGIVEGRGGVEAMLTNAKSGEKVSLRIGGRVLDAVLREGKGERAIFEIDGKRYEVSNGQMLSARRPVG